MKRIAILLIAIMLGACSSADDAPPFPYFDPEGGRVRDGGGILSAEEEKRLTKRLAQAQADYGPQLGIVTVSTLHGYPIEEFSLDYANAWGLGDKRRNDGLMILVAPNERQVRIEVGTGLERSFTNAFCQQVIDRDMLPHFKSGDYAAGIIAGTDALVARMRAHPTIPANDDTPESRKEAA